MPYEIISFSSPDALAKDAAARWLAALSSRNSSGSVNYSVALSGGRITKTLFSEIVRQTTESKAAGAVNALFKDVHFFWADERCVSPTDPESNYAMASQLLFKPLGIADKNIHRLQGEKPDSESVQSAILEIKSVCPYANGQPVLDLVFLGMGEDGHVASLFPGESEATMRGPEIYRAVTAVKPPPRRITLGYATIAAAKEVWVIVSGAGKETALKQSLSSTGKTPLARVLQSRHQTSLLTDVSL